MAFQARVTNVPDMATFMNALVNFAIANGSFVDEGTTTDGVRILRRGEIYWAFYTGPAVTYNYSTTYPMISKMLYQKPTTIATVGSLPGQHNTTYFAPWKGGGPYISFYLYQTGHAVHGVLEVLPNVFIHYSFGVINKNGNFEGGEYITSTFPVYNDYAGATSVYRFYQYHTRNVYPFDGGYGEYRTDSYPCNHPGFIRHIQGGVKNSNYTDFGPIGQTSYAGKQALMVTISGSVDTIISSFGVNSFNLRSPIIPVYVRSRDVLNPDVWYHLGEVPGVGYLNGKLISEGAMADLDWQVFPIGSRENPADMTLYQTPTGNSLAYLRV